MPDSTGIGMEGAEVAFEESSQAIAKDIVVTAESIKQAARDVLKVAELLHDKEESKRDLAEKMESAQGDDVVVEIALEMQKKDVESAQDYKYLMSKVFILQNQVNLYLGQPVQMVYVYRGANGEVELWRMDNTVEDLSVGKAAASKGGEWRGRYMLSKKKLQDFQSRGLAELIKNENYDASGLNATYKDILFRKKVSKNTIGGGSTFIILWNEGNGWEGVKVSSEGVLAESYAGFYLNSVVFDSGPETNVKIFMTAAPHGAIHVDNAPGFLEGDVSVAGSNTQYGIKARGASALGYIQIIQEAVAIYQACMNETPDLKGVLESIKDKLHSQGKARLASALDGKIDEEFENLIKALVAEGKGIFGND